MKVKIVKSNPLSWYVAKIGHEFEVFEHIHEGHYRVINGEFVNHFIGVSDCETVTDHVKIPFTFAAWDKDRTQKVWTRDGEQVKELTFLTSGQVYKFAGTVLGSVETWTIDGKYLEDQKFENDYDLFLEHTEREYWVNVYRGVVGFVYTGDCFDTFNGAETISKKNPDYIKTISFKA